LVIAILAVRISGLPGATIDAVARIASILRHHGARQDGKRDDGGTNQSKFRHAFLPCVRGREDRLISAKPTQTACEPAHIKKNSWHNGSRRGYGRGFGPALLYLGRLGAAADALVPIGLSSFDGRFDYGRMAGLNRAAVGAYSTDVRAATNFHGPEKSRIWLGGRYSVA
jgi:hypothetical protein